MKIHAHPFLYRGALFAHNGTVRNYKNLLKEIPGGNLLRQALDSEVYFRYIMSFAQLGLEKAFRKAVRRIKRNNAYSSLNCLFSDGHRLYGYREYSRQPGYYSLYHASVDGASIISSQPISRHGRWRMIGKGNLLVL